jgi:hypothetical protein
MCLPVRDENELHPKTPTSERRRMLLATIVNVGNRISITSQTRATVT